MTLRTCKAALGLVITGWVLAACAVPASDSSKVNVSGSSRLHLATAAEASGDKQLALTLYAAAAAEAPSDISLQLRCAEGLSRNGSLDAAANLLTRDLKSTPRQPDMLRTLGSIQVLAGQPAQAVDTLSQALAINPDDVKAEVNKAIALDLLRRHAEAQTLYRQALLKLPNDPVISNDLALSLLLSGRVAEARQALSPIRDDPSLPERVRTNIAILEAAGGNSQEAQRLVGTQMSAADLAMLTQALGSATAVKSSP